MRHPDTGELFVNCDPQLIQLIRETECMMKMKLPIPETARVLYFRRTTIKRVVDDLKVGSGISLADAASMPRVRRGDSHIERSGMLMGKFELHLGMAQALFDP